MTLSFPIKFGDAMQYELSERAFDHIVFGETAIRPVHSTTGKRQETVLSGGLHTYEGWKKFVALHPGVVHLMQFRSELHEAWWFARELQNSVIALKIPRRLFTGSAASITQQPDNYYKSGYLWKTVFPTRYSDDDIIRAIGEAFKNVDRELSDFPTPAKPAGVIYGYAEVDDPFTAMLIRIQVRGEQILSAFPAWDQPSTGNNGKPYSHVHSIGFLIAESVLDVDEFSQAYGPVFPDQKFELAKLLDRTPGFIKSRSRRNPADPVNRRNDARGLDLYRFSERATPADLDFIDAYLADYPCAKDPFATQRGIYANFLTELDRWPEVFNAAQITENIGECLWVLSRCDGKFKTRRAVDAIVRFLGMALVHTGGLNTLMFKGLIGDMVSLAVDHVDPTALRDVLAALAASPCRAALYTEFDLNPFLERKDGEGIDRFDSIEMELNVDHLLEFIAFNLGENYLAFLTKEQRLAFARATLDRFDQWRMARDVMSKLSGRDFDFFMPTVLDLSTLATQMPPQEKDLIDITYDYSRMMVMMRQRIVLEDPVAYESKLTDLQRGTSAYSDLERQKYRYWLVRLMHDDMLETAKAYAEKVGYEKLGKLCDETIQRLPKEQIPLPRRIPDYIPSWRQKLAPGDSLFAMGVEQILGQRQDASKR